MKVIWIGIYDRGNLTSERVHFRTLVDIDLGYYAVLNTRLADDINVLNFRVFAGQRSCYWFARQNVKAGDNIVLYTCAGNQNVEKRTDGSIFHFFFRGLAEPLYRQKDDCAVLYEINSWASTI